MWLLAAAGRGAREARAGLRWCKSVGGCARSWGD